jgi:hypothetical protein
VLSGYSCITDIVGPLTTGGHSAPMPRNKLHDAALAGVAVLVLSLIDESRLRRLAEARAAEVEARMAATEAEANRQRSGALAAPPSPEGSVHSSRLSAPRSSKPKPREAHLDLSGHESEHHAAELAPCNC